MVALRRNLETRLTKATCCVTETRRVIAEQYSAIEKQKKAGRDISGAEALLRQLERNLDINTRNLRAIVDEMGSCS